MWQNSFLGKKGAYVKLEDSIRSFKEILEGKHDNVPEQAFYMTGYQLKKCLKLQRQLRRIMADKADKIKVKIITHQKLCLNVTRMPYTRRGHRGALAFCRTHIPITSALDIGVTKIVQGKKNTYLTTMGVFYSL